MRLDELDKNQRKAVLNDSKFTLVCAAPGAGKTTVLIHRAAYLIETKSIPGKSIAIITFTKAASENMKMRFKKFLAMYNQPFIGTFHSLFYNILSEKRKISLIDEYSVKSVILSVLSKYSKVQSEELVKAVINSITKYKNYNFGIRNVQEFKPSIDKHIFIECYDYYEEYKYKNCLVDFEDLQIEALKLIESEGINNTFISGIKHILVDEFQDSDSLEIEFLKKISSFSSIYAVGDEDQSIYSFRNARPDCMVNFGTYFPLGKKIFLTINYRCPLNITNLSEKIIKQNINRNSKLLYANRKTEGKICLCNCEDEIESALIAAETIDKGVKSLGYSYNDYAVLFRTRFESRTIIDRFVSKDIPFTLFNEIYNIYNHFIFQDIIFYMKVALNSYDIDAVEHIINKPQRFISKLYVEKLKCYKYKICCFNYLLYIEKLNNYQKFMIFIMKYKISRIKIMKPVEAANYIFKNIGYDKYLDDLITLYKIDKEEIDHIKDELLAQLKEFNTIEEVIEHVSKVERILREDNKSGVNVSTIHGIKGMEYKNIIIMNCIEGTIPYSHKNIIHDLEEERRLFYVAVTRTVENLYIFCPERLKGIPSKYSRFIDECKTFIDEA